MARLLLAPCLLPLTHTLENYLQAHSSPKPEISTALPLPLTHTASLHLLLSPHQQPFIFCLLSLPPSFRSGDPLTSGEGGRGHPTELPPPGVS